MKLFEKSYHVFILWCYVSARTYLQELSYFISSRSLLQRVVFTINILGQAPSGENKKVVDGFL